MQKHVVYFSILKLTNFERVKMKNYNIPIGPHRDIFSRIIDRLENARKICSQVANELQDKPEQQQELDTVAACMFTSDDIAEMKDLIGYSDYKKSLDFEQDDDNKTWVLQSLETTAFHIISGKSEKVLELIKVRKLLDNSKYDQEWADYDMCLFRSKVTGELCWKLSRKVVYDAETNKVK